MAGGPSGKEGREKPTGSQATEPARAISVEGGEGRGTRGGDLILETTKLNYRERKSDLGRLAAPVTPADRVARAYIRRRVGEGLNELRLKPREDRETVHGRLGDLQHETRQVAGRERAVEHLQLTRQQRG